MISRRIRVYGRVQGIGFRWHTAREANRLGVGGWVRNRRDGSVEIHAEGEESAVLALQEWAGSGPSSARVERIEAESCPLENPQGFRERSTA